jgi:hypothetical protein
MTYLRLTLVFLMLAVAAASAQTLEFTATPYAAPAFTATYPVPDKDKPGVTYSSQPVTLQSGDTYGLDLMLDGAVATLENARPGPKTDSTFSGFPARAVTATSSSTSGQTTVNRTTYERITVQGKRVWQALVLCDKASNCTEADAHRFFNSIKIR